MGRLTGFGSPRDGAHDGFGATARRRIAALGAIGALVLALSLFAGEADAATKGCTLNSQQGKLCLTLSDKPDPVAYSSLDGTPTYIYYSALLKNESRSSSLSHVALTESLPASTSIVRATTTRGSCAVDGTTVTCPIGSLKALESATAEVVVTAPATGDPNAPDQVLTNTGSASFDERFNDQSGGRQDTVAVTENTTVKAFAGQTFVPKGESATVGTDPQKPQSGDVVVTDASTDVLASVKLLANDSFCLFGQVTVQGGVYVCRNGAFLNSSVVDSATGKRYRNPASPLIHHLSWDGSLTSPLQREDNFVVFYRASSGSPTQVFENRCNDEATNMPCLRNIEKDGQDWSVDLVKPDNGRMR